MHSTTEVKSDEFEVRINGEVRPVTDLLPDFDEQSRLGIVVRDDFGAVGASLLLMTAVTAFYDIQRERHPEGFFRYADYFLFDVERRRGFFNMLEIAPEHKEVVVDDDPREILTTINDRAITHLVVPAGDATELEFSPESLASATHRLKAAYLYSPRGRVDDADVEIGGNEYVDSYVWSVLQGTKWADIYEGTQTEVAYLRDLLAPLDDEAAATLLARRPDLQIEGRTTEGYRRVEIIEALNHLSPAPIADPLEPYRRRGSACGGPVICAHEPIQRPGDP